MKPYVQTLALAGSLAFSSCATAPKESVPPTIDAPENWSIPRTSTDSLRPWLEDFNDPALEAVVEEALKNNADLERVSAVIEQSIAEGRIVGADRLPSANLDLNGARRSINTFGPNSTGGVIFEDYDLSLNVNWEIDLWGRMRDLSSSSLARIEGSEAEFESARLSLAAQVAKSWFNILEAQQQVFEAEQTAQAYEKNLQTLESRFEKGLADGLDLRRMRTLAASSIADVATGQRSLDRSKRQLELLLGRYPKAEEIANGALPEVPSAIPAGLPADLIQRRPDLIAAERQLASAEKDLSAKRKDLLPRISLTTSGGTSSREFEELLDSNFTVWALAGNLSQPIFQGGRIRANIDRSTSLRDQARAAYRDAALRAFLEVETALAAEDYLKSEYAVLQIAAQEATAAEALAWKKYRDGTTDFLDFLDAQRTAASSRGRLIAAHNALLQNRIDLHLALGGPFKSDS